MDLHTHLAQRLRALRNQHPQHKSTRELAERVTELGVRMSRATLSKLEMDPSKPGARLPTLVEFLALCHALDTSPLAVLLPPKDEVVAMFGKEELSYGEVFDWLTHAQAPPGFDARWFDYTAPGEAARVNEASRASGLDRVQMAEEILDRVHESYQDTAYDQQRG